MGDPLPRPYKDPDDVVRVCSMENLGVRVSNPRAAHFPSWLESGATSTVAAAKKIGGDERHGAQRQPQEATRREMFDDIDDFERNLELEVPEMSYQDAYSSEEEDVFSQGLHAS